MIWPDGCTGAVSLTFDDGSQSQLTKAVALLNRYDLRATFYIPPRGSEWEKRLQPWKAVQEAGHEIGNHSTNHICPAALRADAPGPGTLEMMTLAEVEADILLAEERLQSVLGKRIRSYAYPCYASSVGQGPARESYVPVVARHFPAGRGTGEFGTNYPQSCDLHYLFSWRCEGMSCEEMIGRAELAASRGAWDIFTYHGVDEGRLGVSSYALQQFAEYLARNRQRIWIAPVVEIAQYIGGRRNRR